VLTWNGAAFSWGRKRQATVFSSTSEAEYGAAVAATREALWVRKLMLNLFQPASTVNMAEDNQASLSLISNPETTGKEKHIDIAHHMVQERVAMGEVAFTYTTGAEALADGLTKALPRPVFISFCSHLGVGMTEAPTSEGDPKA